MKVRLPIVEAPRLRRLLSRENVTAAAVLPSYDGVVKAIEQAREAR